MLASQKQSVKVKFIVLFLIIVLVLIFWLVFVSHSINAQHHTGKGSYGLKEEIILSIILSLLTILNALSAFIHYLFPSQKSLNALFNKLTLCNIVISGIFIIIASLIFIVGGVGFSGNLLDYLLYVPLLFNIYLFKLYLNNKSKGAF
jgi:hypothetical protein